MVKLKCRVHRIDLWAQASGREIVPIFFTGATLVCGRAAVSLPPQLGARLGMVALFCGCTNSPLASICLAIEVFGGQCISLFALACAVSTCCRVISASTVSSTFCTPSCALSAAAGTRQVVRDGCQAFYHKR